VTPKASRRLLFVALGLSLLVHAIFFGWLRSPFAIRQSDAPVVTIAHARVVRITRATPVPQNPAPRPSPTARGSAPPRPVATAGRGVASSRTPAPPTPPPPPPIAVASPCRAPNAPAGLAATPQPGDIPIDARAAATTGTSAVTVHLDEAGKVLSAAIAGSSGNPSLDMVALATAKSALYVPAYKDCKAVASAYTFTARWVAW